MGHERLASDRLDERGERTARARAPEAPAQQLAHAIGNRAFARLVAPGGPVLARTMAAKISFQSRFAQGAQVTPAVLRAIHAELTQAWTDMQADEVQVSFVEDQAKADIATWFTAYGTALTALMAEIQNGNPADPEQVGLALAAVGTPQGTLAQRFNATLTPLGRIRDALNKGWTDWNKLESSKYDEATEKQRGATPAAAAPQPQGEDYSGFALQFDTHGEKHFVGQDSQWDVGINAAKTKMEDAIRAIVPQLPAVTKAFYERFPAVKKQRGAVALYYTLKDDDRVGTLGSAKGDPTKVWTIQVDVYPHRQTIVYHGYPDDHNVALGLKMTKKDK